MKPKELTQSFPFKMRLPLIQDGIFYLPNDYFSYQQFTFPLWKELFGNENNVHIEYCSGNGEWILEKAKKHPEVNWVAVEMKFHRVAKIHSKQVNQELKNLFIVYGKGEIFTREYLKKNSVAEIYINFPDPWPKRRHAKHRLIQQAFVKDLLRILQVGGKLLLVSDAADYVKQMREEIETVVGWKTCEIGIERETAYGSSYFDRLWRLMGRKIHFLEYECAKCG